MGGEHHLFLVFYSEQWSASRCAVLVKVRRAAVRAQVNLHRNDGRKGWLPGQPGFALTYSSCLPRPQMLAHCTRC
jgi:hypothetical protein